MKIRFCFFAFFLATVAYSCEKDAITPLDLEPTTKATQATQPPKEEVSEFQDNYLLRDGNEDLNIPPEITILLEKERQLHKQTKVAGPQDSGPNTKSDVDPVCVGLCNFTYQDCYADAVRFRDLDFAACETLIVDGVDLVDVYCTRTVVTGYRIVITPEGEEIRIPIVETEEYVCGQEEVIIYTEDPERLAEYSECRIYAMEEFLATWESCNIDYDSCLRKCVKGPIGSQF